MLSLTDEEFKSLGITTIGDRARLRSRCRMQVNGKTVLFAVNLNIMSYFICIGNIYITVNLVVIVILKV